MIIRQMTETDLDKVSAMEESIFSTPWSKHSFEESLKHSHSHFYVAVLEDVVGYCGIHNLGGDGEVTNVAVDINCRGKGIAYDMLSYAMEDASKKGVEAFTLEVRVSNEAAIKLYEKLGFENKGIRKNFYEKPVEDAMIMWKM